MITYETLLKSPRVLVGIIGFAILMLILFIWDKRENKKKYRHRVEFGSARWGTRKDIEPYIDPVFEKNVILSESEMLTMNSRPSNPKYARNKNVLVIGGSGSGKTRFFIKPNLLQMHSSYVVTDPKGLLLPETGMALYKNGYRIKVFNTINFAKSQHYNPFQYIRSEKDILKMVNVLMMNTKGEGKSSDPFWDKAETMLYTALIGYIHYEAPKEEQNFKMLLEMINAMEVREDDEDFKNAIDLIFEDLEKEKPDHFAVRQYKQSYFIYMLLKNFEKAVDSLIPQMTRSKVVEDILTNMNYLKSVNVICVSGFISKLIIIVTISINNINYIVSYHFKHKNYFTFFNKELRNL